MISKSFITYAFLLGFTTSVNAQAVIPSHNINPGFGVTSAPPPPQFEVDPGFGVTPPTVDPRDGVTLPPPPRISINPGYGITPPTPPTVNPRDGVTLPPPPRFEINPGFGVTAPPPPRLAAADALLVRAFDSELVDRALASSAKAIFQSALNSVKSAKSPPGNGATAPPPPAQPVAPPGNGAAGTPPPAQPAAPDALPVRAFDSELVDRALASSAKAIFQSVLNNVKSAKSPPGNGVTPAPPPAQPVAPSGNGVTAPPPPAQPAAPPGNSVAGTPPPSQPVAPDAVQVRAAGAAAANALRRRASSRRTWSSRRSANLS